MYYAIINEKNIVDNVIVADEVFATQYAKEIGCIAVHYKEYDEDDTNVARIGEVYIDNKFVTGEQAYAMGLMTKDELADIGIIVSEPQSTSYVIPQTITPRQARLYLHSIGKLSEVEAIVKTNELYQIEWEYSLNYDRNNVLVTEIGLQLGWNETELDNMFIEASHL